MLRASVIVRCVCCVAAALAAGCVQQQLPVRPPVQETWESPPPSPPAVVAQPLAATGHAGAAGGPQAPNPGDADNPADIIAVINGSPVSRSKMVAMLIESHGLRLLEELILATAARQRAAELSLTITGADVAAANEEALRRLAAPIGGADDQALDRQAAARLLQEFLDAKNISPSEWNRRMHQRACLRKIAEAEAHRIEITEEDLRKEYALAYGEKVQIRHIQVSSLAAATRVRSLLAEKKDFELIARQLSENQITAARGGLLPPFTRHDPTVPPLVREVAFGLKVGETSLGVREPLGSWYHILRLERRFPASDVGFENVDHDELRRRLVDRLLRQRQDALEAELFQAATVDIRDAKLARQFQEKYGARRP